MTKEMLVKEIVSHVDLIWELYKKPTRFKSLTKYYRPIIKHFGSNIDLFQYLEAQNLLVMIMLVDGQRFLYPYKILENIDKQALTKDLAIDIQLAKDFMGGKFYG